MVRPGKVAVHHAMRMNCSACISIWPRETTFGSPTPRKLSEASVMMAPAIRSEMVGMTTGSALGRMCRSMIVKWLTPTVRAARMNSRSRRDRNSDAVAANDRELRLTVACRLAQAYFYFGDFRQSARIAGDLAAARPAGELSLTASAQGALPAVHYRAYLALSLTALGHYAEAREAACEGVRLAERAAHDWSLAFALCGLGTCELFQGRAHEASNSFAAAQGLERSADGTQRFVLPGAPIGSAHALAGRRVEGIALIESALHVSTLRGFGTFRQRSLASLARWRLREGRFEEALAYAEEALRLARAQRQRAGEASGLHLLAEILARSDAAGEAAGRRALAACLDALTHAEALGMRPLVARCHETLGALWERAGEADRARTARAAATELCQTLGLARTAAMEPFRTLGPVRTAGG